MAIVAGILLIVSTFMTLIRVTTGEGGAELDTQSGLEHHSVAMLLLGVSAVVMALGALRGARPAMAALAALGVIVLVVAVTVDLPAAREEGLYGERYEGAQAAPASGFYVETVAGALLLVTGGLYLLLGAGSNTPARPRRTRERPSRRERPTVVTEEPPPDVVATRADE